MADLYKYHSDLEVYSYELTLVCPTCGYENVEVDTSFDCGRTYTFQCEQCKNEYTMYFDAD